MEKILSIYDMQISFGDERALDSLKDFKLFYSTFGPCRPSNQNVDTLKIGDAPKL